MIKTEKGVTSVRGEGIDEIQNDMLSIALSFATDKNTPRPVKVELFKVFALIQKVCLEQLLSDNEVTGESITKAINEELNSDSNSGCSCCDTSDEVLPKTSNALLEDVRKDALMVISLAPESIAKQLQEVIADIIVKEINVNDKRTLTPLQTGALQVVACIGAFKDVQGIRGTDTSEDELEFANLHTAVFIHVDDVGLDNVTRESLLPVVDEVLKSSRCNSNCASEKSEEELIKDMQEFQEGLQQIASILGFDMNKPLDEAGIAKQYELLDLALAEGSLTDEQRVQIKEYIRGVAPTSAKGFSDALALGLVKFNPKGN